MLNSQRLFLYIFLGTSVLFQSCKSEENTSTVTPTAASINALTCASATFSATATNGTTYSGTATIPYTGGNSAVYSAGAAIASTGVTGLTATLQAGTLASGAGSAIFAITGTPTAEGSASFVVSLGGQSCTLVLTVAASTSSGTNTDTYAAIPSCTTPGTVAASTSTGVVALQTAMINYRNSLTTAQISALAKCLDNTSTMGFTYWHNTPAKGSARGALRYGDLSSTQLTLFKTLLQAFMSEAGYKKVNEITTLAEAYLNNLNSGMWDPNYYWLDIYGNPASSGSWGFQLDGHHCAINFLVHGDNVSIVPAFLACEPCAGTYNGTTFDIVKDERELGLTMYNAMTTAEKSSAVTAASPSAMSAGPAGQAGQTDPYKGIYSYAAFANGLKYSDMSTATKANVVAIMKEYVYNMKTEFADKWWALIEKNIDNTYFAWKDQVDTPSTTTQFYYRIYNPYLWIEYAMENPVGSGIASYNHTHTITRIPYNTDNGGDYGIFALMLDNNGPHTIQEHYDTAEHHQRQENFMKDMESINNRFASFKAKNKKQEGNAELMALVDLSGM